MSRHHKKINKAGKSEQGRTLQDRAGTARKLEVVFMEIKPFPYCFLEFQGGFTIERQNRFVDNHPLGAFLSEIVGKTRILVFFQKINGTRPIRNSGFFPFWFNQFYWIQVDVGNKIGEISVIGCVGCLEFSLKQRTGACAGGIKIHSVSSKKFLHKLTDTALTFFPYQKMNMVRHKTISRDINKRLSSTEPTEHLEQGRTLLKALFSLGLPTQVFNMNSAGAVRKVEECKKTLIISPYTEDISFFSPSVVEVIKFTGRKNNIPRHAFNYNCYGDLSKVEPRLDANLDWMRQNAIIMNKFLQTIFLLSIAL